MKNKNQQHNKKTNSAFHNAGPYLNIGYFFIGAFILFGFIGYKIDEALGTNSLYVIISLFLALGLSFYNMFKVLSNLENKKEDV